MLVNIKTQSFYSCLTLTENFLGNIKTQIVFILTENFSDNILKLVVLSDEMTYEMHFNTFSIMSDIDHTTKNGNGKWYEGNSY